MAFTIWKKVMPMAGYKVLTEKKLPPRRIVCPVCNFRFYPTRKETKMFYEFGNFDVHCLCGCRYKVINKGLFSIIRRTA